MGRRELLIVIPFHKLQVNAYCFFDIFKKNFQLLILVFKRQKVISEFKDSQVYTAYSCSRTARATQRIPILKNKAKQKLFPNPIPQIEASFYLQQESTVLP